MSSSKLSNTQPLRKTSASLYLLTSILALTTLSTTAVTYTRTSSHPIDLFPPIAAALATAYTLSLSILTLLSTRRTPTFHLLSTLFSTSFLALFIAIAYLHNSRAIVPCTAGRVPGFYNPYTTTCQLQQASFWSAVLAAVGFAMLAVLGIFMFVRARKATVFTATAKIGEADAVSVSPPSYQEKDADVEGEGQWEERVRVAV